MAFPLIESSFVPYNDEDDDNNGISSNTNKSLKKRKGGGFQTLNLNTELYTAIMKLNYRLPTPIQRKTIPLLLDGFDVVAMARTGSGKTAAFVIPLIHRLSDHSLLVGARALILSPTRELAEQTFKVCRELSKLTNLQSCLIVGGEPMEKQFTRLANNPDIICATPGRLVHLMADSNYSFSLGRTEFLVFDEADRLFEMGFGDQIREIMRHLPVERQTCLFSATMPSLLADFTRAGLRDPHIIRLDTDIKISEDLQTVFITIRTHERIASLLEILDKIDQTQQTLIFVATKYHVEMIHSLLSSLGFSVGMVYGQLDALARKINVARFRSKQDKMLVVTDLAARGIDIPLLDNIINFDFPPRTKLFVHRVGRVARAGRTGVAYSLVAPDELPYMVDLFRFLEKPLRSSDSFEGSNPMDAYFGRIPADLISLRSEHVNTILSNNADLQQAERSMKNAVKQYIQTRPPPSNQGASTAKSMNVDVIHPIFLDTQNDSANQHQDFIGVLKSFRPSQTIFEFNGPSEVMKNRRRNMSNRKILKDMEIIKHTNEGTSTFGEHSHKDADNFLSFLPTEDKSFVEEMYNVHEKPLNNSILDLTPDDGTEIRQKQNALKWDRKRKKFVRNQLGLETQSSSNITGLKMKKRTEKGQKLSDSEAKKVKSVYSSWSKRNRRELPTLGATEDRQQSRKRLAIFDEKDDSVPLRKAEKNKKDQKRGKNELLSPEQYRKSRKQSIVKMQRDKSRAMLNIKRKKKQGKQGHSSKGRKK